MPRNGYWIECMPLEEDVRKPENGDDLYSARLSSLPDVKVVAPSPDAAIEKLRAKLRALNRYYRMLGKDLPERDNPVRPPRNCLAGRGWISVYVQIGEQENSPA